MLTLTLPVDPPGYALDPVTGVPIGAAFPPDLRVMTPPFNIAGSFALVFGAIYSAYIFMPKNRVMRVEGGPPVIGAIGRGIAVVVNFFASIPGAWRAFRAGTLELAGAGHAAHRAGRASSRAGPAASTASA